MNFKKFLKFKPKANKYLTKEEQKKRSFLKGLSISIALCSCVVLSYQFLILPHAEKAEREKIMAQLEKEKSEQIVVYRLKSDLPQGAVIEKKDLETIETAKGELPADAITRENDVLNHVLRMDLKQKSILVASMVTTQDNFVSTDLRKQDYSHIVLNKDIQANDYVDIRIKYKDGKDFKVASKKKVFAVSGTTAFFQITEENRIYINNATVKAALSDGAQLYTTIYVDPQNQPAADVDYPLDNNIAALIAKNEQKVAEAQQALVERNQTSDLSGGTANSNGTNSSGVTANGTNTTTPPSNSSNVSDNTGSDRPMGLGE